MNSKKKLEDLVLVTLSFFEPMTFSQIILDFDNEKLLELPDFNREQLHEILLQLEKRKQLKRVIIDKENAWIKIQRKRRWYNFVTWRLIMI